jgi:hypothetical protein
LLKVCAGLCGVFEIAVLAMQRLVSRDNFEEVVDGIWRNQRGKALFWHASSVRIQQMYPL